MTKKNSSLVARIFTWVIAALLVAFLFIPTFTVKSDVVVGDSSETVFSTTVSVKDVLSVAFLSEEARDEKLADITAERTEAIAKLVLDGEKEADATKKVNTYSYSKQYALLKYFDSETEDAVLGIAANSWLVIVAVLEIVMLVALALVAFYSYMCMQYDNVTLPKWNKAFAIVAGLAGLFISLILMICVKGGGVLTANKAILNFFGYVFMALSVYLPLHVIFLFKGRKSYMKNKK